MLQSDIDTARASCLAELDLVVKSAGWYCANSPTAADAIESVVEELGPSKAVDQSLVKPQIYGDLHPTASDQNFADKSDGCGPRLKRLLNGHDRLNALPQEREDNFAKREAGRLRVVKIAEREFVVDARPEEIRCVDNPSERYVFARDKVGRIDGASLTLTEKSARETGAERAEPVHERGKTRELKIKMY